MDMNIANNMESSSCDSKCGIQFIAILLQIYANLCWENEVLATPVDLKVPHFQTNPHFMFQTPHMLISN